MKKMVIIGLICLILSGVFFYLGIQTHYEKVTDGEAPTEPEYIAENKYFGEPLELKKTITPDIIAVKRFVKKYHLNEGTQEERIIKTFDLFERKGIYFYTNDDKIVFSTTHITLKGFSDVWEPPILIIAEFDQTGTISVDCETGSMLLTTLFIAEGIDAKEVLGEVNIPRVNEKGQTYYETYGHGWCVVNLDGSRKSILIESTRGKPLQKFIKVPSIYKPLFIFTNKHVESINGAKMEDIHKVHILTPDGVKLLNEYLDGLE